MTDQRDEKIDPNSLTQKEMIIQLYGDVKSIKSSMAADQTVRSTTNKEFDLRLKALENDAATNKGVRIGLSLAVTILSVTAVAISVAAAFN